MATITVNQFAHENRFQDQVKSWDLQGDLLDGPVVVEMYDDTQTVSISPPLIEEDTGDSYQTLYKSAHGRLALKQMPSGRTVLRPVNSMHLSDLRDALESM